MTFSNFEDNFINSVGSIAFLNRYTVERYLSLGDIQGGYRLTLLHLSLK